MGAVVGGTLVDTEVGPMDTMIKRAVHYALPSRRGVARVGDRVEGGVLVVAVLLALSGVPVAAAVGSEVYASGKLTAVEQSGTRHRVEATLLADAPPAPAETGRGAGVDRTPVPARWAAPDNVAHSGPVDAPAGAKAGAVVRIWVDDAGTATPPPLTVEGAAVGGTVVAFALWGGLAALLALVWLAVRVVRERLSSRSWEREWTLVEPGWTGHR
ncbi:Rv1733c family protein [Saccharothrix variisporea]|uniref:Rv1733c family protein n=1 Tax=Saccharothrix variisporea TaxID=543527 RepID=UPI0011C3602E|nr:hypothetical protein [Saccharothrix variisporea]